MRDAVRKMRMPGSVLWSCWPVRDFPDSAVRGRTVDRSLQRFGEHVLRPPERLHVLPLGVLVQQLQSKVDVVELRTTISTSKTRGRKSKYFRVDDKLPAIPDPIQNG